MSECLEDEDLTQAFNGMVLNQLCNASENGNATATQGSDSSLNTDTPTNPGSGESSQDESSKMNGEDDLEPQPRKKRVSFSEHVQARIYRSNSSILGQKKKNEKKQRSKRRRSESESNETSAIVENSLNAAKDAEKATAEMVPNDQEIGTTKPKASTECAVPFSRRDSGIGEFQENVPSSELVESTTPPPTPPAKKTAFSAQANYPCSITMAASKRVRRLVSSDSAIGEDVLMEEIEA